MSHTLRVADGSPPLGNRILLTTFGSLGDLFPYLAIAKGLQARGHEPVIGTSAGYRDLIERHGIAFRPIRPDLPDPETMARRMPTMMDARRGTEAVIREVVLPALRETYADTLAAARDVDLLVSHLLTFATPLVAEARGLPWASTALQPAALFSATDPSVVPAAPFLSRLPLGAWFWRFLYRTFARRSEPWFTDWHALRAELGLPPADAGPLLGNFSPYLELALFSPILAPPQADWPPRTVATGFPFMSPPGGPLPTELEAFLAAGPEPIVFTLGSSAVMTPGTFYAASARAAARIGRRAILLVGSGAAEWNASLPQDTLAVDYAPHAALFPRAAAIVHQGGIGTTAEAMRSGRPMLVMPFAHDQFDNAARVARLGIGQQISRRRYDAASAARALRRLLADEETRSKAERVGSAILAEDGVGTACAALEGLLGERRE